MKPCLRNFLLICLSFALLAMLGGCSYFGDKKKKRAKRANYYEPIILSSDPGTIEVRFLDVNSYAQPDQALELIKDHCNGSYTESSRQTASGWTTIKAECTRSAGS